MTPLKDIGSDQTGLAFDLVCLTLVKDIQSGQTWFSVGSMSFNSGYAMDPA